MKIFLDRPVSGNDTVAVRDEFWEHYVTTVRRCREGDEIEVVGKGTVGTGTIAGTDPLTVAIEETRPANQPTYRLYLCQAVSRKQKYDDLVRRGSDLGVTDFVPVISEHTVRRPNNPEKQQQRWRRIALESSRISDRDWVSTVHPIVDWGDVFDQLPDGFDLVWGDPDGNSPEDCFAETGEKLALFIGPEGGFTGDEKQILSDRGQSVTLGNNNYRAETASIMLSTIWMHERDEFNE